MSTSAAANTSSSTDTDMHVIKRNGEREIVAFDKILTRLKMLGAQSKITGVNYTTLVIKIIDQLYDGIPTTKIDELTAQQCAMMAVQHPDYGTLASYIIISNAHKNIPGGFYDAMRVLYEYRDANNKHVPIISKQVWDFLYEIVDTPRNGSVSGPGAYLLHEILEQMIDHSRDYLIDYFGYKTLERSYLMRCHGAVVERPQHMWMRVAIGIHSQRKDTRSVYETLVYIQNTYNAMSQKYMTHATPTLFNAGTPRPQLSSCYLVAMENDSIDGIFDTLKDCAKISKHAGGIGLHIHNIRASGSHIRGTNGASNGIVPMLRVFNNTARYIDQGGRRNGSFAIYLEPWHPDIEDFLEMKKNHGDEEMKGRDLFYALWVPDLFMERVRGGVAGGAGAGAAGGTDMWSYFCPDECPGLADVYGDEFRVLYEKYENDGRARKQVKARELWLKILDSQMETGTPYILFKDAVNKKSNQKNVGTIKSSNLCTEIMEYSDENETAVCNLASIALSRFILARCEDSGSNSLVASDHSIAGGDSVVSGSSVVSRTKTGATHSTASASEGAVDGRKSLDFAELERVTALIVDNLNQIIDINYYPTTKTRTSNLRHRPIGIGVQGLADVFMMMNIPFHSEEARVLNREIFETIYYAAVNASMTLAARDGPYETFPGSPASQGILQFDMWGVDPTADTYPEPKYRAYKYDWAALKSKVQKYGLRNSLLLAPMPTASTSQILGNNECFEPITSNIYTRRTLAGEFIMVNRYLISDLITLGMWNERVKTNIIANQGSVQYIDGLPDALKLKYKTVWEMPMRHIIDMAADRGAFICQSQSMNLWVEEPNYNILTSMLFYAWNKGLKTGVYYLRRKAKHQAQQFTVEPDKGGAGVAEEDDICEFCSS